MMKGKQIKKAVVCFLSGVLLCLSTSACERQNGNGDVGMKVSILRDKTFSQGFYVRGLGRPIYDDPIETFGQWYETNVYFKYENENLKPSWRLCQWATRYPFHDVFNTSYEMKNDKKTFNYRYEYVDEGRYIYENQSKTIETNVPEGEVRLALKASECYKYDRTAGQEWPHLLLEQYLCSETDFVKATKISDSSSIRVKLDVKMNAFVDNMGERADPSLHSAMCLFYLFVANFDPNTSTFTDMLWFGIPIFDNRRVFSSEMSFADTGSKESGTDKWIFNIASTEFFDMDHNLYNVDTGEIIFDEWKRVDVELLFLIKKAFNEARNAGYMKNAKWENLYINGMYMGFELPGNYDIDMSFKNVDIELEKMED